MEGPDALLDEVIDHKVKYIKQDLRREGYSLRPEFLSWGRKKSGRHDFPSRRRPYDRRWEKR